MDLEQRTELQRIAQEQQALRAQMERLEGRLARLLNPEPDRGPTPAAPVAIAPPPLPSPPAPPLPPPTPAPAKDSLEMRIGGAWFVRAAVCMLIAALAFLASYLYQHVVPHLGPGGKVALLYLGAGSAAAFGGWLERRSAKGDSAGLSNYARVVLAGGLAAVYYVTYAAHHYEPLRIIASPLLAGLLLLGWTAFMTWLADRRNSETLAAFSILLAYYASGSSEVSGFALLANLGLTAAAVFLVLRRRWTAFSFACLAATYGSYVFWRIGGWTADFSFDAVRAGLATEAAFLACYWGLFTFAALFDRQQALAAQGRRASFVSLNNGAFFTLVGALVHAQYPGQFWKWCLLFGAVLLALGELGRRLRRPLDAPAVDSYLFGGVSLVTLGLILYFSGWQLSLILAVESATVLAASNRRRSTPLFVAAAGVGLISAAIALVELNDRGPAGPWLTGALAGAILVFNAWQCRRREGGRGSRVGEALHAGLGLAVWLALLEAQMTSEVWRAPVLAGCALALSAGFVPLRMPLAAGLAQGFLAASYWHWLEQYGAAPRALAPPLWNPALVLAVTVTLGAAWEWLRKADGRGAALLKSVGLPYEAAAFLLFIDVAWKCFDGPGRFTVLVVGSGLALALAWGVREPRQRRWALALAGCGTLSLGVQMPGPDGGSFGYLPGLLLLVGAQQFGRRVGRARGISSPRWEGAMISLAALGGWAWVTARVEHAAWSGFPLSAGWAIYGGVLFTLGIVGRERVCRWWGLAVLGATFARILLHDIWQLGSLERFFSLFAVGLVLLAIGFVYNRFPSKIREWL